MSQLLNKPSILFFKEITNQAVGGKAAGLAELTQLGFDVPAGFVIVNAEKDNFPDKLIESYQGIGAGKVAVRSSALGEDAVDNSFAGQFETILNVEGEDALKKAINDCVASLDTERAAAYQADKGEQAETTMCVVVQQMVDAKAAGVLFTADPVTGRFDRLVIDAVEGLGEALVDGSTTPDHYEVDESGKVINQDLTGESAILSDAVIQGLAKQSRNGAENFGKPLDMEWAIDADDNILWLQARPITTIGSDLRELDTHITDAEVLTRCNVSEVIPGVCCPLTYSTQVQGIQYTLEQITNGLSGRTDDLIPQDMPNMSYSHGYLFINLTAQIDVIKYTVLVSPESTALPICGRVIPELKAPVNKKNIITRVLALRHLLSYVISTKYEIAEFAQRFQSFYMPYERTAEAMYERIDENLVWIMYANKVHGHASSTSGILEGTLQSIISKGEKIPTNDEQALAAKIMSGAEGVESAMLVEQTDALVDLIAKHPKAKEKFAQVDTESALKWLRSKSNLGINKAFDAFMENHGHRGYRELEIMTPAWADDPLPLVGSMQASVQARFSDLGSTKAGDKFDLSTQPWHIRALVPKIHKAIRGREQTKSLLVKTTHYFKRGYRHLAELMVKEKYLSEADDIYFLTHEEIGEFLASEDVGVRESYQEKIRRRKINFSFQEKLQFSDVVIGKPKPLENVTFELEDGQMQGRPVSKGVVEGVARVALTVEEAASLQPGEILIAPITDVAWTPYFSLISGLATDIGSAVSHGAVIAREYGLPCIVNLQGATQAFKTGDRVRLDAETGILSKLEQEEAA